MIDAGADRELGAVAALFTRFDREKWCWICWPVKNRLKNRKIVRKLLISRIVSMTGLLVAISGLLMAKESRGDWPPPCGECEELIGFVQPSEIDDEIRMMVGKYKSGGGSKKVALQKARGVIETGLYPEFFGGADCPEIDSEKWAIDYSHKRRRPALHKGIDIPQPRGAPIRAVANGVVVGRFLNKGNRKGIEVMLRHTPEQTGLPFWTYSQYTHLLEMSHLPIGARVRMGDEIGKTSNSGKMGRRVRRDALHFAILYSAHPEWSNDGVAVTPRDGFFMDPNAFYRLQPPYDSQSLSRLPPRQKHITVPHMKHDGAFEPRDTRRIWPYACN